MGRALFALCLFSAGAISATATQLFDEFEIASVRPSPQPTTANQGHTYPPNGFRATRVLRDLIAVAYEVQSTTQVTGGPGWLDTLVYDVDARTNGAVTRSEVHAMLRTLLRERFGLVVRRDPNGRFTAWVLRMMGDGLGPGMRRANLECINTARPAPISERRIRLGLPVPCGAAGDGLALVGAGGVPIARLVFYIQLAVGEEVVDQTGLTGTFDFYVRLPRRVPLGGHRLDAGDASIFTVVQEDLGMRLRREEVRRELITIERVSQLTPN